MIPKILWLKLAATISLLIIGGCIDRGTLDLIIEDNGSAIVLPDPVHEDSQVAGSSVSFAMDAEQFGQIAAWLGNENTLTIENPIHVEQKNVTLDAKAGTKFSYTMGEQSGTFTFERPIPTLKAGFATKIIGGVALHDVTLNADGSGMAATGLGRYRFRWCDGEADSGVAGTDAVPEVWAYSMPACPPCATAKKEFSEAKDLPFQVVWKEESAPDWLASRPAFWWHVSEQIPTQKDVENTRQIQGWNGIKDFQQRWKASRSPKRFVRGE